MAKDFKSRYVNEITGTFVLLIAALLIAGIVLSERSQQWFSRKAKLTVVLPESGAQGLRPGGEVYVLGLLVGTVRNIAVGDDGRMQALISMRSDFARFVRDDSSALLKKQFGVAGDGYLEITRGSGATLPADNPVIHARQDTNPLQQQLEELQEEALPVLRKLGSGLDSWGVLGTHLDETQVHLRDLIVRLDRIAVNVEQGEGTVGRLLTEPTIADELQRTMTKAGETMEALQTAMNNLSQASENLRDASLHWPGISAIVGEEVRDLPGLAFQASQTLLKIEQLVEGLQKHWLVRDYIAAPAPAGRIPPAEVNP